MHVPVTLVYGSLLGLIYVFLSLKVTRTRKADKVEIGTGNSDAVERAVRTHANFIEYVPIALILIGLLESAGAADALIRWLAGGLIVGRLLHIWGFNQPNQPHKGRILGTLITWLVILVTSLDGLYLGLGL